MDSGRNMGKRGAGRGGESQVGGEGGEGQGGEGGGGRGGGGRGGGGRGSSSESARRFTIYIYLFKKQWLMSGRLMLLSANISQFLSFFCVGVIFAENALPLRQAFLIHW